MLSEEEAIAKAMDRVRRSRFRKYVLGSVELFPGRAADPNLPFLKPSGPRWLVRFMKPQDASGSITDDGDVLVLVEVDPFTGVCRLSCGFQEFR